MEVHIISREFIKPSSQAIQHLKPFKLSLLDQLFPTTYFPIILFYPTTNADLRIAKISTRLKRSLSDTLSTFYPFSGRVKDNSTIENYEEGVPYIETRVNRCLFDFLKQPELELLNHFLPCQPFCYEPDPDAVAPIAVQVNIFDCGGIAIALSLSHKFIDAATASTFLNSWAANTSGSCGEIIVPDLFEASMRFPPQNPSLLQTYLKLIEKRMFKDGKSCTKRFVFDAKSIDALRAKAKSDLVANPSRIETLSCFIWKSCTKAARLLSASPRLSISSHTINIRQRAESFLPKYSIGNLWLRGITTDDLTDTKTKLSALVALTRETLTNINFDYLHNLQGEKGFQAISKSLNQMSSQKSSKNAETFVFSSWLHFGFNELDFGWGKPIWFGLADHFGPAFMNCIFFTETGRKNEIEAWMILHENIMSIVGHDPEFLKFVSLNPSCL